MLPLQAALAIASLAGEVSSLAPPAGPLPTLHEDREQSREKTSKASSSSVTVDMQSKPSVEKPILSLSSVKASCEALFSSERSKQKKHDAARDQAIEANVRHAAHRILQLAVSRAWNSWAEFCSSRRNKSQQLTKAAKRLMNPGLSRGLGTWIFLFDEHKRKYQLARTAARQFTVYSEVCAWATWLEACEGAMKDPRNRVT